MDDANREYCFPNIRMRRLRTRRGVREMLQTYRVEPRRIIWPVFLRNGAGIREPIPSLPSQNYVSPDVVVESLKEVYDQGVRATLLFADIPDIMKGIDGRAILQEDGVLPEALERIKNLLPELVVFADLDLSEYTTHGHSGVIDANGIIQNDKTLDIVSEAACLFARFGADGIAPSGMTDGQVKAIRASLDAVQKTDTLIMSYSTKFASRFYDCFRQAVHNTPRHGSRADCQIPISDRHQAIREGLLDEAEAADLLMVKPALSYLDIIYELRCSTRCPIAAFNVSGEYAMAWHAPNLGIGDRYALAHEMLTSIHRAGANLIISYWGNQLPQILKYNET